MLHDIYIVSDLSSARQYFLYNSHKSFNIINIEGSIRFYGMVILDNIFLQLLNEFNNIIDVIVNVENDTAGLFTALKLNYKKILYKNNLLCFSNNLKYDIYY